MRDADNLVPDFAEVPERAKNILLWAMFLLSGVFGVLESLLESSSGWQNILFYLDLISFVFCLSVWCGFDAQVHGYELDRSLRWSLILVTIVGFPVYAFRSRGRLGWSLLRKSLLFLVLLVVFQALLAWATLTVMYPNHWLADP